MNQFKGDDINRLVRDLYAKTVVTFWRPERGGVKEGNRTRTFPFTELTPPECQMECQRTLPKLLGYFSTWSAVSRYRKSKGQDPLPPFAEQLARLWGAPEKTSLVRWPLALRVVRN